jgi:hypothetical protein
LPLAEIPGEENKSGPGPVCSVFGWRDIYSFILIESDGDGHAGEEHAGINSQHKMTNATLRVINSSSSDTRHLDRFTFVK